MFSCNCPGVHLKTFGLIISIKQCQMVRKNFYAETVDFPSQKPIHSWKVSEHL